jgi:hypothetical protein
MTAAVHADLARRALVPAEHYVDAGYPSAHLVATAKTEHGIDLIAPLPADNSAQARAGSGYDRASFTFDFDARPATCPQGKTSTCWTGCTHGPGSRRSWLHRAFHENLARAENSATGCELAFHAARSYSWISPPSTVRRRIRSVRAGNAITFGSSFGARSPMPSPWWERPAL